MVQELVKNMLRKLDTMLEYDESIAVDSVDEIVDKFNEYVEKFEKESMTEIKAGNCYMCLKDKKGYDSFTKGKIYVSLYDNALINDNHIEVKVMPSNCFRIATDDEIKAQKTRVERIS